MTLLRQLVIVIVTLFILLFVGTLLLSINNTRDYLNDQLRTISQDTATSLGLTLTPPMAENDMAVVDRMVSAVSDSGYYREVVVSDVEGKPIVSRKQDVKLGSVPQWFVDAVPLDTPRGEALIMAGWQQAGTVRVEANPGYAYVALWTNTAESFWWFLAASTVTVLLGVIALHFILRPLRDVEMQARAICDREYPVQKKIPWTLELRSVVEAMNRMSTRVKEMFDEQTASIERLRSENYRDSLTGLANRRYFEMNLKQLIETGKHGALLMLELKDFKQYNEKRGYQAGDELLKNTAEFLEAICKSHSHLEYFTVHLNGANFAVVLTNAGDTEAMELGQNLAKAMLRFKERGLVDNEEVGHIGIALFTGQSYGEVLSAADMALRAAQQQGPNAVNLIDPGKTGGDTPIRTATQWGDILREALASKRISLLVQPAKAAAESARDTILHYESLMRLTDDQGSVIPAVVYTPVAKRLRLATDFDRAMIVEVLARLAAKRYGDTPVAVNLFPASLQNAEFVSWLCDQLAQAPAAASRLLIEVSEYGMIENVDALRDFIARVATYGTGVGLDHFGRGFSSFGYLSTLKLDYIKIDGSYVRGILENKDNQFFIESVIKVAHGLEIKVFAVSVETQEELNLLSSLGLDGVQGYGVGRPEAR
ncbi:MAG: EAL domain-containing protein [Methylophilaceae bacterium]